MKYFLLSILLSLSLLQAAKEPKFSIGVLGQTTYWGYTYFYTPALTVSIFDLHADVGSSNISLAYIKRFASFKGIHLYTGLGLATFMNLTDSWMIKIPAGVSYDVTDMIDTLVEFNANFTALSSGELGSFGLSNTINVGVRLNF